MYRIRNANPVSWFLESDGSQGEVECLSERPDYVDSDELPDGEEINASIQGHGTRAFAFTEDQGGGTYTSYYSVEEIDED